jgi:DNA-binding NarL/FixJ family response regulator
MVAPLTRVLVLTISDQDADVMDAILAGACGYLLKDAPIDDVVEAVRAAARGVAWLAPKAAEVLLDRIKRNYGEAGAQPELQQSLSPREIEVLQLVARGLDNTEIAAELSISPRTAKNHVSSILAKLEVPNRIQAATYAVRTGLA